MNYRLTRLIAVITTSTLIVAACSGGSSTSSRTRNTVMAAQPCITVTPFDRVEDSASEDVISFCPGAVSYSFDGGITKLPVPESRSVEIPEQSLPEQINLVQTLNVISYDGAEVAINDDLVQVIFNTGCADGYACTQGEIGPFGGAVLITDSSYLEIMPLDGKVFKDVSNEYLNRRDAVENSQNWSAANIENKFSSDTKWRMVNRGDLAEILQLREEHTIYIPRMTPISMSPDQNAPWCDRTNESTCTYENYWVEEGSEQCQSADLPLPITIQGQLPETRDVTVGFPACNQSLIPTLETPNIGICSVIDGSDTTAECKARVIPIRRYQPKKSRIVEVSQYDSDNWQYKCLGKPNVSISQQISDEEMTVSVSSPCMAQASEERPVKVHIDLVQLEEDGSWTSVKSTTAPLEGDVGGQDDRITGVVAPTKTISKTYVPQEKEQHVVVYISFPEVGKISRSESSFQALDIESRQVSNCTSDKLVLSGNKMTANCGGTSLSLAIGGGIQSEVRTDDEPVVATQDASNPNTVQLPGDLSGWRRYKAVVSFADGKPATKTGLLCIVSCVGTQFDDLKIEPIDAESVLVTTKDFGCASKLTWLLPVLGVSKTTRLIGFDSVSELDAVLIESIETVVSRPASDIFVFAVGACTDQPNLLIGLKYVGGTEVTFDESKSSPAIATQTKVADFLDTNIPSVKIAAEDSIINFEAPNLASVVITTNGKSVKFTPQNGTIKIPIAKDTKVLDITTVASNGETNSFTKAVSRPGQLPSSESVAITAETSSNKQIPLLAGLLILLILCGFGIMKIRTSKKSS